MNNSSFKKTSIITATVVMFALAASVNPVKADWPNENPTKWVQYPDLEFGMNVLATAPKILADDFLCTFSGPITDIHIWGSWLWDQYYPGAMFKLSIHADVPATPTSYSHPGPQLWSITMAPTAFLPWYQHDPAYPEPFYDPNSGQIIGSDTIIWQYNFIIPETAAFRQEQGKIYWLDVQAWAPSGYWFGWKTSRDHWNDDAVYGDAPFGGVPDFWHELRDPRTGQSLDLAFALTTIPEPGTVVLLGLGAGMLAITLRRRTRS